jgi:hypothetical protein
MTEGPWDIKNLVATTCDPDILRVGRRNWACSNSGGNAPVNDTWPEVERMVHERLMALSGEERFMMGISMYDTARAMVLASLPPNLSPVERRRQVFKRFYGDEMQVDLRIFEGGVPNK